MAVSSGQVGEVGVHVPSSDAQRCVVAARQPRDVRLAEDADEVGDPLLVPLPGQQRHDHQLNAQEHEKVAPFGLDADHGDDAVLSKQRALGEGSAGSHFARSQPDSSGLNPGT